MCTISSPLQQPKQKECRRGINGQTFSQKSSQARKKQQQFLGLNALSTALGRLRNIPDFWVVVEISRLPTNQHTVLGCLVTSFQALPQTLVRGFCDSNLSSTGLRFVTPSPSNMEPSKFSPISLKLISFVQLAVFWE